MKRFRCTLSYKELEPFHMRPASFINRLCERFRGTEFRVYKIVSGGIQVPEPINPKSPMALVMAGFKDGEEVVVEVEGKFEIMAAEFFRIAWENLDNYSADVAASKARLARLIDERFAHIEDPDLDGVGKTPVIQVAEEVEGPFEECRSVATINDRLHNLSLPMIPLIARHFGCRLQISFEEPAKGIVSYTMERENGFELSSQILEPSIEVGTRITVLTTGSNRFKANESVKLVLQSLWQCDEWLRRRGKDWETEETIKALIEFAGEVGRSPQAQEYGYVQNPFISTLLTPQHVLINPAGSAFSKDEALSQLAAPHARQHGLELPSVLHRVKEAERKQPVLLREGFAIAHGAMDRSPRLSITFGVYPTGVPWKESGERVNLVAMVICALDTYGTWRDYLRKFAILFRLNPGLQAQLVAAPNSASFLSALRRTETAMIANDPS